jgi:hypothetical protein
MRSAGIDIKEALCFVNGTVAFAVPGLLLAFVGGTFVTKVNAFFFGHGTPIFAEHGGERAWGCDLCWLRSTAPAILGDDGSLDVAEAT